MKPSLLYSFVQDIKAGNIPAFRGNRLWILKQPRVINPAPLVLGSHPSTDPLEGNFSCCPFCSTSDIHPWRVHMCQTSPAHNLILYSIFFYWTPTKCWDEQSELTIPLCFPMYFQLRVWEPCFPWMFPRVLAFISPISLPKLYIKHLPAMRRPGFDPWVGKIPWRRK